MDRIIVKTNADMERVIEFATALKNVPTQIPFHEGEIELLEELSLLKFRVDHGTTVRLQLMIHGKENLDYISLASWTVNLDEWQFSEVKIAGSQNIGRRTSC